MEILEDATRGWPGRDDFGEGDEKRSGSTSFEKEVLNPLLRDLQRRLASGEEEFAGVRAIQVAASARAPYDFTIDVIDDHLEPAPCKHPSLFDDDEPPTSTLFHNNKYLTSYSASNVAGSQALLGTAVIGIGAKATEEAAWKALCEGRAHSCGYIVTAVFGSPVALVERTAVLNIVVLGVLDAAGYLEKGSFAFNPTNGLQIEPFRCRDALERFRSDGHELPTLEECRSLFMRWLVNGLSEARIERERDNIIVRLRYGGTSPDLLAAARSLAEISESIPVPPPSREIGALGLKRDCVVASEWSEPEPQPRTDPPAAPLSSVSHRTERDYRSEYARKNEAAIAQGYASYSDRRRARETGLGLRRSDPRAASIAARLAQEGIDVLWIETGVDAT